MDNQEFASAGTQLRDRVGRHTPTIAFVLVGIGLLAVAVLIPAYETLLLVWGGTALFGAFFLQVLATAETVRADVATDVQTATAGNVRRLAGTGDGRYVPGDGTVSLVLDGHGEVTLDPVGERLLASLPAIEAAGVDPNRLGFLVDALVNELELVASARIQRTERGVELRAAGLRIGCEEPFDHPVASVVGVGLARAEDRPVRVETTVDGEDVVVTATWD